MTRLLARHGLRLTERGQLLVDVITAAAAVPLVWVAYVGAWAVLTTR